MDTFNNQDPREFYTNKHKMADEQTLQAKNLEAAKAIYYELKALKAISYEIFRKLFFHFRADLPSYGIYKNWETTERFLVQKGIMTINRINGLRIYIATQKCVRTQSFENAIK